MSSSPDFAEFLHRVRSGDARAGEDAVRRYESAIRLAARTRLSDPALKRHSAPELGLDEDGAVTNA